MKMLMGLLALLLVTPAFAQPSPSARPSPRDSSGAAPSLAVLIERLPAADPAESFAELEAYVKAEDLTGPGADPAAESTRRARQVLSRFDEIKKAAPPPPEKVAGELAQLLFTVGRALEEGGSLAEARPVYERIVTEFPTAIWEGGVTKETIAQQAQARLRWHAEKHPWVVKDLPALIAKLREAFTKHDGKALSGLISRIGFWSGPFASEGGADDPERVLKLLEATWPASGPAEVAAEIEAFSEKDRQVFLKVSGFTGEFTHIFCILEKEADGWQWNAVAFAEKPGSEPAVPEPDAPASPASPASPGKAPAKAAGAKDAPAASASPRPSPSVAAP